MSETMELINELTSILKNSKSFILEQAPDIIQQMLIYNSTVDTYLAIGAGIVGAIFVVIFIFSIANDREGTAIISFILGSVFFAIFVLSSIELTQIKVAPKVFLLERLINLSKTGCR